MVKCDKADMDARCNAFRMVVGLLAVVRAAGLKDCDAAAMSRCTDPLRVLTNNLDLGFAATKSELRLLCPKLIDGLRCVDNFTLRCMVSNQRAYFTTIYAGTNEVILDLCSDGEYQNEFLRHAPCMRMVQDGYEACAHAYQLKIRELNTISGDQDSLSDEESQRKVCTLCCSFRSYLECSKSVVREKCGSSTAQFSQKFLDRMAGPLMQGHCRAYKHDSKECSMDENSSAPLFWLFHQAVLLHSLCLAVSLWRIWPL